MSFNRMTGSIMQEINMSSVADQRATLQNQVNMLNNKIEDYNNFYGSRYAQIHSENGFIPNNTPTNLRNNYQSEIAPTLRTGLSQIIGIGISEAEQERIDTLRGIAEANNLIIDADRALDSNRDATEILEQSQQSLNYIHVPNERTP
jgi:hypothetical protein